MAKKSRFVADSFDDEFEIVEQPKTEEDDEDESAVSSS